MTTLPKYLLAYNREALPHPVVLQTEEPYIVGKIWPFKDGYEFIEFVNGYTGLGMATVLGYQIAITFDGVLTGHKIKIDPGILRDIKRMMQEMAEFYKKEKIDGKPDKFKRFLL